ncbi:MAG TPA: hypothetical protein PK539_02225 [Candidatus Paceibacterota bacterium]|nr:hypothetical protein [Candidatus Paceibacterota bacterium]
MKKILIVLVVIVALLLSVAASAATVEVLQNGSVRLAQRSEVVRRIDVHFDKDVFTYGDAWKKAWAHPGVPVPVASHVTQQRDGLFHTTEQTVVDTGIMRNATGVHLVHGVKEDTRRIFNPLLIFWAASGVMMWIFVWEVNNEKGYSEKGSILISGAGVITLFITGAAVAIAFVSTTGTTVVIASSIAVAATLVALIASAVATRATGDIVAKRRLNLLFRVAIYVYAAAMGAGIGSFLSS